MSLFIVGACVGIGSIVLGGGIAVYFDVKAEKEIKARFKANIDILPSNITIMLLKISTSKQEFRDYVANYDVSKIKEKEKKEIIIFSSPSKNSSFDFEKEINSFWRADIVRPKKEKVFNILDRVVFKDHSGELTLGVVVNFFTFHKGFAHVMAEMGYIILPYESFLTYISTKVENRVYQVISRDKDLRSATSDEILKGKAL